MNYRLSLNPYSNGTYSMSPVKVTYTRNEVGES